MTRSREGIVDSKTTPSRADVLISREAVIVISASSDSADCKRYLMKVSWPRYCDQ